MHELLDTSGWLVIGRESLGQKHLFTVKRDLKILDVGGGSTARKKEPRAEAAVE